MVGRHRHNRAMLTRRTLLAIAALAPLAPARAADFTIDWQGGPQTPEVAASLAAQIALVKALPIDPDVAAFFASQPILVDRAADTATRAGPRGIFFERRPLPPENPVLLHELIHRFHLLRLPDGFRNADVLRFYQEARGGGRYPPNAYMLKNQAEFFAMTASVTLYGRAARPPFVRANVAEKSPDLYAWIVKAFGLRI